MFQASVLLRLRDKGRIPLLQLLALLVFMSVSLAPRAARAETPVSIDMKLLVIAATPTEPTLNGIKSVLDRIGIPYDTLIASQEPLTAARLSNGLGAGRYQGVLLTTGNLGYADLAGNWVSALSNAQWNVLWNYERDFRVRQATLYTYPVGQPDTYGLTYEGSAGGSAVDATLTPAGKSVFGYLKDGATVPIRNSWTYLARPLSTTNPTTLLATAQGHAIVSVYKYPDGRENLAITTDGNEFLTHSLLLGYGVVNWASKGVFIGQRKIYMTAQPDDMLIADDLWDPQTLTDTSGLQYRITGHDYNKLVRWQNNLQQADPNNAGIKLEMPFNGQGATGIYKDDTLTREVARDSTAFNWISHTYSHALLTTISQADAYVELALNDQVAVGLGLADYYKDSMIQPEISGLANPAFFAAAKQFGIRNILSDASRPEWRSPTPNTGFYSSIEPSIFIIPRYATNLYYNVSTPAEWVSEYNSFYAPGGRFPYWDHALTYEEILDKESDLMLRYLLRFDVNPLMFHQTNLRAYDQQRSLLGDLMEATLRKFNAFYNIPIQSPSQHEIAKIMSQRMVYNAATVRGTIYLNGGNPTITLTSNSPVVAPLTGVNYGGSVEIYGGQPIAWVGLTSGSQANIPAPAW